MKRTGIIAGCFDVIHPGYVKMFKEASDNCDHLIIALHNDPSIERPHKLRPVLSSKDRLDILSSIKYIDQIILYDTEEDLHNIISVLKPTIRFQGDDYKNRTDYTGYGLCPEVYFFNRNHGWSSTRFKEKIWEQVTDRKLHKL